MIGNQRFVGRPLAIPFRERGLICASAVIPPALVVAPTDHDNGKHTHMLSTVGSVRSITTIFTVACRGTKDGGVGAAQMTGSVEVCGAYG